MWLQSYRYIQYPQENDVVQADLQIEHVTLKLYVLFVNVI
jgi:hypothetical protein